MSVFEVDFNTLVKQLLPVRLRQAVQIAWLKALTAPVRYVYGLFYLNRLGNLYLLAHNGQVCYLEAALNDTFDNVNRRIYLGDANFVDPVYLYRRNEDKPVWLSRRSEVGSTTYSSPVWLYRRSECYDGSGNTFNVYVPLVLGLSSGQVAQLKALVNLYKLPGRNYSIVYF